MNILSNLPKITDKRRKRLGRGIGSGRGSKSGRGTTRHQAAREDIPLHFEGGQNKITKKFPLLRGKGRNKSIVKKPQAINFSMLNKFKVGERIDLESLIKRGLVDERVRKSGVKVVVGGKLDKKLIVKLPVSKPARRVIEKLGGQVE